MKFSDFAKEIKKKYEPAKLEVQYTPCSNCKTPLTKYCIRCGKCGRQFDENGFLLKEAN